MGQKIVEQLLLVLSKFGDKNQTTAPTMQLVTKHCFSKENVFNFKKYCIII